MFEKFMKSLIYTAFLIFTVFFSAQAQMKKTNNDSDAGKLDQTAIKTYVDEAVKPLLEKHNIPGMAVALTINGENYFFNYGLASKETQEPVTNETIFEIGSISKTFTGTLASYAQVSGKLSFSDNAAKFLPQLKGSGFDKITVLNLGTYTSGGLPLQVPGTVENYDQLISYYKNWQSDAAPGTQRVYSNASIGLLGIVTAKSFGKSFEDLMEKTIFPKLGMKDSYINVPESQMKNYAWGYNREDVPVRVNPGVVASEAYGLKSTSKDMIRFLEANMNLVKLDKKLRRAIDDTHVGYFKLNELTQNFIWEQYPYPAGLQTLLAGSSNKVIFEANAVVKLNPPTPPQENVWINKTGSTAGFGGYVAFVPAKKIGIVMLANKNYPIDSRIAAAHQILSKIDRPAASVAR